MDYQWHRTLAILADELISIHSTHVIVTLIFVPVDLTPFCDILSHQENMWYNNIHTNKTSIKLIIFKIHNRLFYLSPQY